jgi:hypothetical protein
LQRLTRKRADAPEVFATRLVLFLLRHDEFCEAAVLSVDTRTRSKGALWRGIEISTTRQRSKRHRLEEEERGRSDLAVVEEGKRMERTSSSCELRFLSRKSASQFKRRQRILQSK